MNALFITCGTGVFALLAEIFNLKRWVRAASFLGLLLAMGYVVCDWAEVSYHYQGMVFFDRFAMAFTALILVVSFFWFWMSVDFFTGEAHRTDKSALLFFAISGAIMMVSFNNMAVLFLGIEIVSLAMYVLAGSNKENLFSTEAGFKYFLMGSFATGFLLFGITLVYGATESFNIMTIGQFIATHAQLPRFLYIGILLIMVGLAFKISAVPFHLWVPDVYEGSPTAVTAFMSTVVKIAAVGAFVKIFSVAFVGFTNLLLLYQQALLVLTLVVANITAMYQSMVKRMLAYSSVGHVGYLLLAFSSDNKHAASVIFFYLSAYAAASILAFTVVQVIETKRGSSALSNFQGLFKSNPLLATALTIALLSLAGIPPLAGFFGKYLVFTLAIGKGFIGLTILAVFTSLVGVYFYFKPIVAMSQSGGEEISISLSQKILLIVLMLLNLAIGIFPDVLRIIF